VDTVVTVAALVSYLARLYAPLPGLSNIQVSVMTALVSFERVFEVLYLPPMIQEKAGAIGFHQTEDLRVAQRPLEFLVAGAEFPIQQVRANPAVEGMSVLRDKRRCAGGGSREWRRGRRPR
jgi:ATP-binding cassette subfamily B protein